MTSNTEASRGRLPSEVWVNWISTAPAYGYVYETEADARGRWGSTARYVLAIDAERRAAADDRSAGLRAWMEDDDLSTPHVRLRFSPRRREAVESALRAYAESGVEAEALRARLAEVERELRTEKTEASVARSERGDAKTESARLLAALRTWAFDWDGKRWVCRDCGRSLYRTGERTVDDVEHEADCGLAAALDSERWRTRRDPADGAAGQGGGAR